MQTMLLGPRQDMEDIAEAVRKVQATAPQLVKSSASAAKGRARYGDRRSRRCGTVTPAIPRCSPGSPRGCSPMRNGPRSGSGTSGLATITVAAFDAAPRLRHTSRQSRDLESDQRPAPAGFQRSSRHARTRSEWSPLRA